MAPESHEWVVMLGYAVFLAVIALLLEWAARHTHRRSFAASAAGFTYHSARDVWSCPRNQPLFPIASSPEKGLVIYRAAADTCNSCESKAACTDSSDGREIERRDSQGLEFAMKRFHRAMSLTLLALGGIILTVALLQADALVPRIALATVLAVFCLSAQRVAMSLSR
jgi:hypothetical protein